MQRNRKTVLAAAVVATMLAGRSLRAATLAWDADGTSPVNGGSGTWDLTSSFWTPDNGVSYVTWINNAVPDVATFGAAPGTVTVDGNINVGAMTFSQGGYTLAAGLGDLSIGS